MTPVLIDQNSLLKAGITTILVVAGVFVSGYTIGYRSAESGKGVDLNKTMVLALPKPAHADLSAFEPLTPQVAIPGAEIDVDRPELAIDSIEQSPAIAVNQAEQQFAAVIAETTHAIEVSVLTDAPADQALRGDSQQHRRRLSGAITASGFEASHDTSEAGPGVLQTQHADATPAAAKSSATGTGLRIVDTASADQARYTIQVGAFSNTDNAIRKKTELESRQLSAYINEYRNKSDQARFNVRFGYFKDKSSATAALSRFEQDMSGSGYVTRIRRH